MELILALVVAAAIWHKLRSAGQAATPQQAMEPQGINFSAPLSDDNQQPETGGSMALTLTQAIARQEGFGVPDAIPTRDDNPGDLENGSFAQRNGALPATGRFAVFSTVEDGFNALRMLLLHNYVGMTLSQAISKFAPGTENNTAAYIANVSQWTGIGPDDVITPEMVG